MRDQHPVVLEYLNEVCKQIKARELRKEIRLELEGHLEELVWEKRELGMDEEAAARLAIEQMGDSTAVAAGLNQIHKPSIPWGLLSWLTVLIAVALVTMYALDLSYASKSTPMSNERMFMSKAIFTGIGLLILLVLTRVDYRKLLGYSSVLYGGTLLLMIFAIGWGPQVNGARSYLSVGPLVIDIVGTSPYLLLIAVAGMLAHKGASKRKYEYVLQVILFIGLPVLLYVLAPATSALITYTVAYLLLLVVSGRSWRFIVPQAAALIGIAVSFILIRPFGRERLEAFLHRDAVSPDAGWMYIQIDNAIRSAGWWGHGFASFNRTLPYAYSDTVFTYIIYSLGWFAGAFVLFTAILFVVQLARMASQIRDSYGKMLITSLGSLFTIQFVWNIGMSLGILPIVSIAFPFISYGGSHLLIQLAAVGMICSVYQRKDMIRIARTK
ncbi:MULTISPECIES: FtsW/RodA/SpoVE family cell cycle protein [unclassified Paenibacillus]|uniref:FtsW/RodA/SpoVE family cell cycle protein n=1 Tax=unclassified Paenibacillus TaxID=185978 RepID=UPI00362CA7CB